MILVFNIFIILESQFRSFGIGEKSINTIMKVHEVFKIFNYI